MNIFEGHARPPETIRLPRITDRYAFQYENWSNTVTPDYIELIRVYWISQDEVKGIPVDIKKGEYDLLTQTTSPTYYRFPAYKCERCKTSFIGHQISDFWHTPCCERVTIRAAA